MSDQDKLHRERVLESLHRMRNASSLHTLFSMSEMLQTAPGETIPVGTMNTLLHFLRAEEGLDNLEFCELEDAVVCFAPCQNYKLVHCRKDMSLCL